MNILIINLTRMGDILQSTPLMEGLKNRYHGSSITHIVDAKFEEICRGIPFIDHNIVFDMGEYKRRLHSDETSIVEDYRFLEELIERINKRHYNILINLTPSRICAILTSLVRADEVRGLTIDREGHRVVRDPWMRYFCTSIFNRLVNPFNIVDMYQLAGRVRSKRKRLWLHIPENHKRDALRLLEKKGVREGDLLIGFQPGASKEHKRWSASKFSELGRELRDRLGARILIFGSSQEEELGREIKGSIGKGAVNLVGKTNLMELAALIEECRLLVTNDSGTMHIATAVGTRVIELSLGAAYFRETGPYGDGHIVIESQIPCHPCNFNVECKEMMCREYIRAEHVYKIIENILINGESLVEEDSPLWQGVQLYRSTFDGNGLIDYIPIIKRQIGIEEIYLALYRSMWKTILTGNLNYEIESLEDKLQELAAAPHLSISDSVREKVLEDMSALKRIKLLSEKGMDFSGELIELVNHAKDNLGRIKRIDRELSDIDGEIEETGLLHSYIRPITHFFNCGKEGLEGDDLFSLAKETYRLYRNLENQVSTVLRLLERLMPSFNNISSQDLEPGLSISNKSIGM